MKKSILGIICVLLFTVTFAAEKENKASANEASAITTLSGHIADSKTNEGLVGVKVELGETGKVAYTDFDGNYTFESIKAGNYSLKASYVSYSEKSVNDVQVSFKSNQVNLKLETIK